MISFKETDQLINTIIGNGKRFMAYEIVKRLKCLVLFHPLEELAKSAENKRKQNNKKYEVWELSFDWKECNSDKFIDQKLSYMHLNPCSGKWNLCSIPENYEHSSTKFYEPGIQGIYTVLHIEMMKDIHYLDSQVSQSPL
ncbi:MAG: hypothetical protein ABIO04_08955 [Ferruginibacter sp.]